MPLLFTVMLSNGNDFNLVVRQANEKALYFLSILKEYISRCLGSKSSVFKEGWEGSLSKRVFAFSHLFERPCLWIYLLVSSLSSTIIGTASYLYTDDLLKPSFKSFRNWSSYKFVASKSAMMDSILSFLKGVSLRGFLCILSNSFLLSSSLRLSISL